jgi:hypothetical protein
LQVFDRRSFSEGSDNTSKGVKKLFIFDVQPYNNRPMIYYTQLIFIKPGCEQVFHAFEDKVLPLLKLHNGELVYRIRPDKNAFVAASRELPYEVHIVTFGSKADFAGYAADPRRLDFMEMKNNSVEKIVLIEGAAL